LKSKEIQDLIKKIAKDNNITIAEVKFLIKTQFKFVSQVMRNSGNKNNNYDFKSVYIPHFGSFKLAKKRVEVARRNLQNKKENNEERKSTNGDNESSRA